MKKIISKTFAVLAAVTALLSFTPNSPQGTTFGGEGFEILVNGKVVLQKFGDDIKNVKFLDLSKTSPTDKLSIKYHHCGKVGKNRTVTIKDAEDRVLKIFRFTDVATPVGEMSCSIGDLVSLKDKGNNVLKLFYSSTELPKGRQLASVIWKNSDKVQP